MLKESSRATVTVSGLEKTIVAAVQQSSPRCQDFIGVYIEYRVGHQSGANWCVKGVKYGRAPRAACDVALDDIVRNLQERYLIEPVRLISNRRPTAPVVNEMHQSAAVSPLAAALKRISQRS